jgi:hypothetical protein
VPFVVFSRRATGNVPSAAQIALAPQQYSITQSSLLEQE